MADNNITRKSRKSLNESDIQQFLVGYDINARELIDGYKQAEVKTKMNNVPDFPTIMIMIAAYIDFLDMSGFLISLLAQIAFFPITFFWFKGRMKGRMWKGKMLKVMLKKLAVRSLLIMGIELAPGSSLFIPGNIILVLMAHYSDKKFVIALNYAMEVIHDLEERYDKLNKLRGRRG
jgi:hypothetical protein